VSDRWRDEEPSDDHLQTAARVVARAKHLVVFTGAGVSKESGIPTFREPETGLWAQYDPMELATPEAYSRDPAFVWSWFEHRFGALAAAEPNPGHRAIAELEQLLPRVTVITQNIDGLHQRAGSTDVVELHGSMFRFKCLSERHNGFVLSDFAGQDEKPPRCPECGDILRPDVVWFGEALPGDAIDRAGALCGGCDVMLVVGTSGVVFPAAALPLLAAQAGAVVIDVNPERDAVAATAGIFLRGAGGVVLPKLVAAVQRAL
jgi:NAD-dependent deacetylase